jgi:glycosyltransferase involved in cell wall biosynthesis
MISCIVPAFNEEKWLARTLESLLESVHQCREKVEIIVVDNCSMDRTRDIALSYKNVQCAFYPVKGREAAKNHGAEISKGNILCFVDADLTVTEDLFQEISEKSQNHYFVGGGIKHVRLSRYSFGICASMVLVGLSFMINQVTAGAFWIRKDVFNRIGGFRNNHTLDDIDFAIRLKKYAKENGKKFESLKRTVLTWNTRRFDEQGDWYWFRVPPKSFWA